MKKIIAKKTYNTDTAEKIKHITNGSFGDPSGYEEILYKTKKGDFFLYGFGGDASKYPSETIAALTAEEAKEWKKNN